MPIWWLAIPLAAAVLAAAYFWRQTLNLKEAFTSALALQKETIDNLQAKVAAIPALIVEARIKAGQDAVAEYIANNPPAGGTADLDGLTYDDVVSGLREVNDNTRNIHVNAEIVPTFFENERVHGNPTWPNDPPA